jgi:outer membrane protein assembly factor BamB
MKQRALVVAVGFALAVLPDLRAGSPEWPGWRGPDRDGVSRETGLASQWPASGPPLLWKAGGMGAGFSSLAVVDGRLYTLGDRDGAQQLIALNASDGALVWKSRVGPVWSDEYGGPRGTPSLDGGLVFALGTEGDLVAVEAPTYDRALSAVWHHGNGNRYSHGDSDGYSDGRFP